MVSDNTAILSNKGEYTSFRFRNHNICFYTGCNLDHYSRIIEWDHGYLVVMCVSKSSPGVEEEDYIDLVPILQNLYFDSDEFLDPIEKVKIQND